MTTLSRAAYARLYGPTKGDVIRLADLVLPAGTTAAGDPDIAVVTTMQSSVVQAPAAEAEAESAE